jgi:hypothetical protein
MRTQIEAGRLAGDPVGPMYVELQSKVSQEQPRHLHGGYAFERERLGSKTPQCYH